MIIRTYMKQLPAYSSYPSAFEYFHSYITDSKKIIFSQNNTTIGTFNIFGYILKAGSGL